MEKSSLVVLHCFKRYLPMSQNWAYRIIDETSNVEKHVYAVYYEKSNFYNASWKFVDFGASRLSSAYQTLGRGLWGFAYKAIMRLLMAVISKRSSKLLRGYIHKRKIDIVHSHFGPTAWAMGSVVRRTGVKHVVSFYGFDYERLPFQQPVFVDRYGELFRTAHGFICEGTHGANTLERLGCPREKLHVVHLGIDATRIQVISREKKPNSLKLVQIASLTEKKGHFYTIRAFLSALKEAPNMSLTIVGSAKETKDSAILNDIGEQIKARGADKNVRLIPRIDYDKLYEFLGGFDVFIHPSCYASDMDSEGGAPVVLLDAQATGMPVISTTHCDIPDEVIHGETGLLSPEKDIDALKENILKFYHMDADEYSAFAIKAREHVVANYNITKSGNDLRKVYEGLLS